MIDVCCDHTSYVEYTAMDKTNVCCTEVLFVGNLATNVCCTEVLFQPSFLVPLNALPDMLYAERCTVRTTEPDTAQT